MHLADHLTDNNFNNETVTLKQLRAFTVLPTLPSQTQDFCNP
jgi:hypothetical protein